KYQTYLFETQAGKIYTGVILEETPQMVKIIENPLVKADPIVLKQSDIADKKKKPASIMPKGLLDPLTHEGSLEFVAYVLSRGDAKHAVFQGAHEHGSKGGH